MNIQRDTKAMGEALGSYFEAECDREIAEEVGYHLSEIKEVAARFEEAFKRLSEQRGAEKRAQAVRLLEELRALMFERAIIHAKDLRRPLDELLAMLDEDREGTD